MGRGAVGGGVAFLDVPIIASPHDARLTAGSDRVRMCITRKLTQFALGRPLVTADAPAGSSTNRVDIGGFLYLPGDLSTKSSVGIPQVPLGSNLRFTNLERDLGAEEFVAQAESGERYVAEGVVLGIAGVWQAEVSVRRPDAFDAQMAFRFDAGSAPTASRYRG